MKFLLDENIGKKISVFLRSLGHITYCLREINPGIEDYEVLNYAVSLEAILITSDKDFGELVFKEGHPHSGIIFLRLDDQSSENKIQALKVIFSKDRNLKDFLVITEQEKTYKIRVRKIN